MIRWRPPNGSTAVLAACLSVVVCLDQACSAGRRDVEVAVRALEFLAQPIRGDVIMAILYSVTVPGSRDQAERLAMNLAGGVRTAGTVLVGRPLALEALPTADDIGVLFVPDGMGELYDRIFAEALRLKVPTVSTDVACVVQSRCLMAVRTTPRVEITVSQSVADRSGVGFQAPFRLMVTIR